MFVKTFLQDSYYCKTTSSVFSATISYNKSFGFSNTNTTKAFISYAWPQDITARNHLQHQLLQLVEDLSHAGIRTLLDIMQLHPGSDVKKFMEVEIENSDTILWIGTPDLKSRIKFNQDGMPETNAAIEFCHIKSKLNTTPNRTHQLQTSTSSLTTSLPPRIPCTVQSLLFRGNSPREFPENFEGLHLLHDFTKPSNYYVQLPPTTFYNKQIS